MDLLKTTLLTASLTLLASTAQAAVEAVNIVLWDEETSYDVPAGKTLIIEHFIWRLESGTNAQFVSINPSSDPGSGAFLLKFPDEPDSWTPTRPIRLAGGGSAQVSILFSEGGADWRDVMVCGLLVDNEDLYAANIDTTLEDVRFAGNTLLADVKAASPRPRVTKIQTSEDLHAFAETPDSSVTPTTNKSVEVAAVTSSSEKKFFRVTSKARPLE